MANLRWVRVSLNTAAAKEGSIKLFPQERLTGRVYWDTMAFANQGIQVEVWDNSTLILSGRQVPATQSPPNSSSALVGVAVINATFIVDMMQEVSGEPFEEVKNDALVTFWHPVLGGAISFLVEVETP